MSELESSSIKWRLDKYMNYFSRSGHFNFLNKSPYIALEGSTTYVLSRTYYYRFRPEHEEDAGNTLVRWLSETCRYIFFVK